MPARQNFYAESNTESNTTDTAYQDKATLTFTPDADSTYVIIASWLFKNGNTVYFTKSKLCRTSGTAKDFNELQYRPRVVTEYRSGSCMGIDAFGASPTAQTYKIQYCTTDGAGAAYIKEARIIAIKLGTNDSYAQSEDRSTTALTTFQIKVDHSQVVASGDEWLVLMYATFDHSENTTDFRFAAIRETIDLHSYVNIETTTVSSTYPQFLVRKLTGLTVGTHLFFLKWCAEGGTAGIAHARIVLLKLNDWNNNYYAENRTRATYSTDTNWQDFSTLTQTPVATDHLLLFETVGDGASNSYNNGLRFTQDGESFGDNEMQTNDGTSRGLSCFSIYKKTLAAQSYTWKTQYKTFTAAQAAGCDDSAMIVLELGVSTVTEWLAGIIQAVSNLPSTLRVFNGIWERQGADKYNIWSQKSQEDIDTWTLKTHGTEEDWE